MTAVSNIRALRSCTPQLAMADRSSGVIVLSTPSLRWRPLSCRVESPKVDLNQLLEMKQTLRSYLESLYSHGVAYRVKHEYTFPVQKMSLRWVLYLGGWHDAELCADPSQLVSPEWKEREAKELREIERIFELVVMRYEDREDERNGLLPHRCNKWTLDKQLQRDSNRC